MKILVTGASGFIGIYLIQKLQKRDTVTVYGLSRSRVSHLDKNYVPITADLSIQNWTDAIPTPVDAVVHLAQSKRYRDFPDGAEDMMRVNIGATLELLEWSRKNQAQKFLFASTGNVYKSSTAVLKETNACEPGSMYAATKLSAEFLVRQYKELFQTIGMRIFTVYGPRQKDMIIPSMIDRVRKGQKITLAQGAGIYLTPLYISDCIAMIERLLTLDLTHHDIFNLAGTEILHLGDIVSMIAKYTRQKPNVCWTDEEPHFLRGNNDRICRAIDYQPTVSFSDGIKKTLQEPELK